MGLFNLFKKPVDTVVPETFDTKFDDIINQAYKEYVSQTTYFFDLKPGGNKTYQEQLLPLADKHKVDFIVYAVKSIHDLHKTNRGWSSEDEGWRKVQIAEVFIRGLLRTKLILDDSDLLSIINAFQTYPRYTQSDAGLMLWPINFLIGQAEKQLKDRQASPELVQKLKEVSQIFAGCNNYTHAKDSAKLKERVDTIIHAAENKESLVRPVWFPGNDDFASYANESLKNTKPAEQTYWFRLMALSQKASGGTPSKKIPG